MCDLGSRAHTGSHSQLETGAAPGRPNQISIPRNFSLLYPGSCDGFRSFWRARGAPTSRTRGFTAEASDSRCHPACPTGLSHVSLLGDMLAGRSGSPKVPARSADPRVEAGWEHPCIPWQGSREGQQQQQRLEAAREGRKEEGTGTGSRGAGPVGAAWLFSMGGAHLCHRLGLITGTCLQPRRLPGSVIASNWAGLGSRAHPRASTALPKLLSPQCHPPVLVALGWGPCASQGGGGQASPSEFPERQRGLINSKVPRDYTNAAWRL